MKHISLVLVVIIPILGFGQTQQTLSKILWSRVNNCYSMFEDWNEDGVPEFDKIDDAKNGYLKISGSWPTCGCSCSSEVGAYKDNDGEYTILQSDEIVCSWERKISSNKELKDILPLDFGVNSFMIEHIDDKSYAPIFLIDFEIPRIGTDTKVRLELIPLGLFPQGDNLICFEYKEQQARKPLHGIRNIAKEIADTNSLTHLLNGDFDKISAVDKDLISKEIGTADSHFKSITEIQEYLIKLKKTYDVYANLAS
ncbi:MAG: hypothetical protein ACPG5P_06120, partial [Saprospiraceae bacterium]